jgi:hypothetical protein
MAQATDVLMSEHRGIERMLAAMERNLGKLESGDPAAVRLFEQGVDFLRGFADKCHHHKEEQQLFPALAAHGIPVEGGPVGVMLHEHEAGRERIREMAIALPGAASTTRRTAAAPSRWPAARGNPRAVAQRPLPSMMIPTCRPAMLCRRKVLCTIKSGSKKKRRRSAIPGCADDRFHVVQVAAER